MVSLDTSPCFMAATPRSQPLMTWPAQAARVLAGRLMHAADAWHVPRQTRAQAALETGLLPTFKPFCYHQIVTAERCTHPGPA